MKIGTTPAGRYIVVHAMRSREGAMKVDQARINTASQDGKAPRIAEPLPGRQPIPIVAPFVHSVPRATP